MQHFSDRSAAAIRARRSVVCVGLDPALERLPPALIEKHRPQAAEIGEVAAVAAGFVVKASRSIIYAWRTEAAEYRRAAAAAAESMRNDLAFAV